MRINHNFGAFNARSPFRQLAISLFMVIVIGTALFILIVLAGSLIFNTGTGALESPNLEKGFNDPGFIRFTLIAQDICIFIIPAAIILTWFNPGYKEGILRIRILKVNDIILVIILALCAFPVTSLAGQINAGLSLPDSLSGVEQWMKDKEDYAYKMMELIMTPSSFAALCMTMIIVAVLPAVSEELIFRGVFQQIFRNLFRSSHLSVWFTAILFSAIHLQFFGFLPRFILGLIFGYLFLWSNNLWLPIIVHFINNAVPTAGAYLKGWEVINAPFPVSLWKQISGTMISLIIGIIILAHFRKASMGKRYNYDATDSGEINY